MAVRLGSPERDCCRLEEKSVFLQRSRIRIRLRGCYEVIVYFVFTPSAFQLQSLNPSRPASDAGDATSWSRRE